MLCLFLTCSTISSYNYSLQNNQTAYQEKVGKLKPFTVNIMFTCNPTILFLAIITLVALILSKISYINTKHYGRMSPILIRKKKTKRANSALKFFARSGRLICLLFLSRAESEQRATRRRRTADGGHSWPREVHPRRALH